MPEWILFTLIIATGAAFVLWRDLRRNDAPSRRRDAAHPGSGDSGAVISTDGGSRRRPASDDSEGNEPRSFWARLADGGDGGGDGSGGGGGGE